MSIYNPCENDHGVTNKSEEVKENKKESVSKNKVYISYNNNYKKFLLMYKNIIIYIYIFKDGR